MIHFVEDVPIQTVVESVYNPRKIEPEATAELIESIRRFGMIKPLIINRANNVIVAGHQRRKAALTLNLEVLPCVYIRSPKPQDEIQFNIVHNSIEISSAKIRVSGGRPGAYTYISCADIAVLSGAESLMTVHAISSLLSRYGEWGSVICDEEGNVLFNSEYAFSAKQMGYGVLAYTVPNTQKDEVVYYLSKEYGAYYYDDLPIKTYHQTMAQPGRMSANGRSLRKSTLYEKVVMPTLTKEKRLFDLGAGRKTYVKILRSKGYAVDCYEPSYRTPGVNAFDIREIVADIRGAEKSIRAKGQYDVVVLDAVINSVVNDTFEDIVIMVCNALCAKSGALYTSTRSMSELTLREGKEELYGSDECKIYALDAKGYSLCIRNGVALKQKHHTDESFVALLERYFQDVKLLKGDFRYVYCEAKSPRKLDLQKLEWALNEEFNIEYPGNYRHNRHKGLVQAILQKVSERDGEA